MLSSDFIKAAYMMELEAEVAKLKEMNEELQKKQVEMLQKQKNELTKKEELKTVVDKVKDFFGDVTAGEEESFAQITGSAVSKEEEEAEGKEQKFCPKRRKKRKSKQGLKTEK